MNIRGIRMQPQSSVFQNAVHNTFVSILNKIVNAGGITSDDSVVILKQIFKDRDTWLPDSKLRKNVYWACMEIEDLLKNINLDYPKVMDMIEEAHLETQRKIDENVEDRKDDDLTEIQIVTEHHIQRDFVDKHLKGIDDVLMGMIHHKKITDFM